jgi:hypothetical protein
MDDHRGHADSKPTIRVGLTMTHIQNSKLTCGAHGRADNTGPKINPTYG